MESGNLEKISLWHKYKSKVWSEESTQAHSIHSIARTLRSVHNQKELAYLSVPITSGKILYDEVSVFDSQTRFFLTGSNSSSEKYEKAPYFKTIMENVISQNYNEGYNFLEDLKKRIDKPVLFPADLFPRGEKWSQDHFQALWTTLISEHATEMHMCKNWEYSNGAVEEFTHAYQLKLGIPKCFNESDFSPFYNTKEGEKESRERMKNIKVYDFEGKELGLNDGLNKISKAVLWVKENDFNSERLENSRQLLEHTGNMIDKGFYQ